jgi:hypothetical protein
MIGERNGGGAGERSLAYTTLAGEKQETRRAIEKRELHLPAG